MPIYEERCGACGEAWEYYAAAPTEETRACLCGGRAERIVSLSNPQVFRPFKTRNIHRDGKEIEIRSQRELSRACREHGVEPAGDKDNTA